MTLGLIHLLLLLHLLHHWCWHWWRRKRCLATRLSGSPVTPWLLLGVDVPTLELVPQIKIKPTRQLAASVPGDSCSSEIRIMRTELRGVVRPVVYTAIILGTFLLLSTSISVQPFPFLMPKDIIDPVSE